MTPIAYDTPIFNLHDFVLISSTLLYLLLAVPLLIFASKQHRKLDSLLAGMLLIYAAANIDTLIIWSAPVRHIVSNWQPNLFFLGGLGLWCQGPLLLWFVNKVIDADYEVTKRSALHLVPFVLVTVWMLTEFHFQTNEFKVSNMRSLDFLWSPFMDNVISGRNLSMICYGWWCMATFAHKKPKREAQQGNDKVILSLLFWLISGSILLASWTLVVHLIGGRIPINWANVLGLGSNYLTLVFVLTLMVLTLRQSFLTSVKIEPSSEVQSVPVEPEQNESGNASVTIDQISKVQSYMEIEKPYLDSKLNLESLAVRLKLPERTLSRLINQHLNKNVVEYINSYRVSEAKKLLVAEGSESKPMLNVMADSGFNSKSTFNSAFKQIVGKTPSQFRKDQLSKTEHY
jgi:AraC-like DNA-binding protein